MGGISRGLFLSRRGSRDDLEGGLEPSSRSSMLRQENGDGTGKGSGRRKIVSSGSALQGGKKMPLKKPKKASDNMPVPRYQKAFVGVLLVFLTYRAYIAPHCACQKEVERVSTDKLHSFLGKLEGSEGLPKSNVEALGTTIQGLQHEQAEGSKNGTLDAIAERTSVGKDMNADPPREDLGAEATSGTAEHSVKSGAEKIPENITAGHASQQTTDTVARDHKDVAKGTSSHQKRADSKHVAEEAKLVFYGQEGGGQHQPDKLAFENFFKNSPLTGTGYFVEVGAQDGIRRSNTLFFEETLKWRGLLIEGATPNVHELQNQAHRRPQSKIVGKAICSQQGTTTFVGDGGTAGMMSTLPKGHRGRWSAFWKDQWKQNYEVPCDRLGSILREEGVVNVDFLSIDVSGAEAVVLESIDFDEVKVRVLVVEMGHSHRDEEARSLLRSHGFCFAIAVAQNEFWTSDDLLKARFCH